MTIEVKVPVLPESVSDATILNWHKKPGDAVKRDEILLELETDKVILEVPAPESGVLQEILQREGTTVVANDPLALIKPGEVEKVSATPLQKAPKETLPEVSPAVRRLLAEHNIDANLIQGTGKGGRIVKEDVMTFLEKPSEKPKPTTKPAAPAQPITFTGEREEKCVPMSRLRAKIAERLVQAQHNAAMLTTFNEINLHSVVELRARYKQQFEEMHNIRLGFMSFFTKASIEALQRFPAINASIDGSDIIYHGYYDIGIAVSTERGLVVPVLRNADKQSMADIEKNIADFAERARQNKLRLEEIQGGTFTITNGGVFGSLMATPILNPPQVAILGMHKIEKRPVVEDGEIVIRPMMYVALSYDHRIVDGKDSVQFLVTIKELLEDPSRLLIDV